MVYYREIIEEVQQNGGHIQADQIGHSISSGAAHHTSLKNRR
jgi:hypothetical protein